jgi:hypothetical protein
MHGAIEILLLGVTAPQSDAISNLKSINTCISTQSHHHNRSLHDSLNHYRLKPVGCIATGSRLKGSRLKPA